MDSIYKPQAWKIARWSEDPYCLGSWSQLLVNGSPDDRKCLGSPFSKNFILAGEACDTDFPAMVDGAMNSGLNAADFALSCLDTSHDRIPHVVIIGAGAAGIAAAHHLKSQPSEMIITILEARNRIGGRIDTHELEEGLKVDAGATWLHHFDENQLAVLAKSEKMTLIKSDFYKPLNAAKDGPSDKIREMIASLGCQAQKSILENENQDMSLEVALKSYIDSLSAGDKRKAYMALEEIRADSGVDFNIISGKYALEEPGVGNGDYYMKEGYTSLLASMLSEDIEVCLNTKVTKIDWEYSNLVKITTSNQHTLTADFCICTLPISLLQQNTPLITPALPHAHQQALSRMKLSTCDKVILKFPVRWWPTCPGGILHWYNNSLSKDTNWVEWLDMTDGIGAPVVMAFIAGTTAVKKYHHGKSDEEIAMSAAEALREWADCVKRDQQNKSFLPFKITMSKEDIVQSEFTLKDLKLCEAVEAFASD